MNRETQAPALLDRARAVSAARRLLELAERVQSAGWVGGIYPEDSDAMRLACRALEGRTGGRCSPYVEGARDLLARVQSAEYRDGVPVLAETELEALRAAIEAERAQRTRESLPPSQSAPSASRALDPAIVGELDNALRVLLSLRLTLRMQTWEWSKPLPPRTFAGVVGDLCRVAGESLEFAHALFGGGGPGHFTRAPLTGLGFPSEIAPEHATEAELVRGALLALIGLEGVARLDYARADVSGFHAVGIACVERAGAFVDDVLRLVAGRWPVWSMDEDEPLPELSDVA